MPARQHAASVGIMPTLKRKIAMAAPIDRRGADGSRVVTLGASKDSGKARTGTVLRNTVWIANQMARLSTTPTPAGVIADSAPLSALLPRKVSMKGAPRKI